MSTLFLHEDKVCCLLGQDPFFNVHIRTLFVTQLMVFVQLTVIYYILVVSSDGEFQCTASWACFENKLQALCSFRKF